MSSRKEQKERLRQERVAREQAEAAAAARKRRLMIGGGALGVIALVAVVAIAIASSGGGGGKDSGGGDSQTVAGVQTGPAPWSPEGTHLGDRFEASGMPQSGSEQYHIHALLKVYVNGEQTQVPQGIGIDPQGQFLAALHTHDASGIVHMESDAYYPFTLGQFFNVAWGVKFTNTQLGAYYNQGQNTVQVYVNGKKIANPVSYKMQRHDTIVVAYGKPGSFPTKFPPKFPAGL